MASPERVRQRGERARGDLTARELEELHARYSSRVYRFCLGRLGAPQDAEEATQDTFLSAWRSLSRGQRLDTPLPWLLTVARNRCISEQRARSARPVGVPLDEWSAPSGPEPRPGEAAMLAQAVADLPEPQRRVLVLRDWRGLSYDEIGDELDLSYAGVAMQLFRARRSLAEDLRDRLRRQIDRARSFDLGTMLGGVGGAPAGSVSTVAAVAVVAGTLGALAPGNGADRSPAAIPEPRRALTAGWPAAPAPTVAVPDPAARAAAGPRPGTRAAPAGGAGEEGLGEHAPAPDQEPDVPVQSPGAGIIRTEPAAIAATSGATGFESESGGDVPIDALGDPYQDGGTSGSLDPGAGLPGEGGGAEPLDQGGGTQDQSGAPSTEGGDPPGQGGGPPGESERAEPPGVGDDPPGQSGDAPGLGGDPPGLGSDPPGQSGDAPGLGSDPPGLGSDPPGLLGSDPPGKSGDPPGQGDGPPGTGGQGGQGGQGAPPGQGSGQPGR